MRLFPIRHAETTLNREGRVQGLSSAGLTPRGRRQAEALARALAKEPLVAVYSSPLARALETARPIAARHGLVVQKVPALQEVDAGELEGLLLQEMRDSYSQFMARWREDPTSAVMPGGESLVQVLERAWPVVEQWKGLHLSQTVVAVTHNFVTQMLLCRMLGLPSQGFRHLRTDLATITEVEWRDGRWVLLRLNDACHLSRLPPLPQE